MASFPVLKKSYEFAKEEEEVLRLWDEIDAFKRSIQQRKDRGASPYTFYDGPPFATGLPHYGHMVASSIKDTVARYFTMRGHYVERRFGWDTHGLPIEMETEKALGLSGPQSIRAYGIDRFNEACRSGVLRHTEEWRRIIRRLGRWVDFDNDFKTMDRDFMESVWWTFSKLWDLGLVYQGFRVMPYSVRLSTPLSNFEANLNYQEVQDPAVTVKAELVDEPDTHLLIWTTTPWTLPSNLAIAVGRDIEYIKAKRNGDDSTYIVAKALADKVFKDGFLTIDTFKGDALVGLGYRPIYPDSDYGAALVPKDLAQCFQVIPSDHVTTLDGTGLVHMAPAFGADDMEACAKAKIPPFDPLDEEGRFNHLVKGLLGMSFKDADKVILKNLKDLGKLFDRSTIVHSYPFCWRSNTPLIYKAVPVWFVDVPKIKERMGLHNRSIHWVPETIGHKRFANWLKDASEWSISRNRFWGTPIPIWQCQSCEERLCVSSVAMLEDKTGQKVSDLHSHFIDGLEFPCEKCQGSMHRIPEVFDCWFESGSMPVAQIHYPFENVQEFERSFPADFIAEGLDQTRGWFYTLLVLSTALFDQPPFKNVVVNGMVLAADGSKMSKSKKNYPDPEEVINKYGSDAVRCYLLSSPVVRAEPLQFKEEGIKEIVRSVFLPLYNCWSFFVQYANIDGFDPKRDLKDAPPLKDRSEIDRFIISRLQSLIDSVNSMMDNYFLYKTIKPTLGFIEELTNWYIRRSRRRFWKNANDHDERMDKLSAYATLYEVLTTFSKVVAPIMPFLSESIYQNLVVKAGMSHPQEDSIHLCDFPEADREKIDHPLETHTETVRRAVALGRALREKHRLKTRQPLRKMIVVTHDEGSIAAIESHEDLIKTELNVKDLSILREDDSLCRLMTKPNYKTLGPRVGADMGAVSKSISGLSRGDIHKLEGGEAIIVKGHSISLEDVMVVREAMDDVVVAGEGQLLVALDVELDAELRDEGLMREALSQLQRLRKAKDLEVTSRIDLKLMTNSKELERALLHHQIYLGTELLVSNLNIELCEKMLSTDKDAEPLKIDGLELWAKLKPAGG